MNRHTPKLHEEDARAIDLLLNHSNAAADASAGVKASTVAVSPRRLAAAQKTLAMLATMPAIDPPAGLAQRTMARIDRAASRPVRAASQSASTRPHA